MTPGSHPFEALEDALLKVAVDPPAGLMEELTSSGISEAVQSLLPETGSQLLLIVDQLELNLVSSDSLWIIAVAGNPTQDCVTLVKQFIADIGIRDGYLI